MFLQTPTPEPTIIQIFNFLKLFDWAVIITILLFITAYVVNEFLRRREEKRRIDNLKTVIFSELLYNNFVLINLAKKTSDNIRDSIANAYILGKLEHDVYDTYLGKLNLLQSDEFDSILFAYRDVKDAIETRKEFNEFVNRAILNKEEEEYDTEWNEKRIEDLNSTIKTTLRSTSRAAAFFSEGREDFKEKFQKLYKNEMDIKTIMEIIPQLKPQEESNPN